MTGRHIKTQLTPMLLAVAAMLFFCSLSKAEILSATDSVNTVSFTFHHIVDGDLNSDRQVEENILAASSELKTIFEELFSIYSDVKHTQNLKVKICSDIRACVPSRYQPATSTIFIKAIDYSNPTKGNVGMIIAAHEYTHRVFHSLMSDKVANFSDQFFALESKKILGDDEERFMTFLNFSYIPITELVADLSAAVFFNDANVMTIAVNDILRGFRLWYAEPDDFFYESKMFGKNGALVPNPYLMLVPLRNLIWRQCVPSERDHTKEGKKKIIMNILNRALTLNESLYSKSFGAGLTQKDLLNGVRSLCK